MARLRYLQYVYALAREGSFKSAAIELHISQPALSKGIAALEREYGIELFDRSKRPLALTPAGRLVLAEAERCLQSQEELHSQLLKLKGLTHQRLRMSWGPYAYCCFAERFALEFQRRCPDIELHYRPATWIQATSILKRAEVDLAVADISTITSNEFELTALTPRAIRLVCAPSHPLASLESVELSDVFRYKLALPGIPLWARPWLRKHMPESDSRQTPACLESDDFRLIGSLVATGEYCTLIAAETYCDRVEDGTLIARKLVDAPFTQAGIIALANGEAAPASEQARELLLELDQAIPTLEIH